MMFLWAIEFAGVALLLEEFILKLTDVSPHVHVAIEIHLDKHVTSLRNMHQQWNDTKSDMLPGCYMKTLQRPFKKFQ